MSTQKKIFSEAEGLNWFNRNKHVYSDDPETSAFVLRCILEAKLSPKSVLEIGSSSGGRLELIRERFDADCVGIDPSESVIKDGLKTYPKLKLMQGTADALPFDDAKFDLIIFGFCLYLCDRSDLFRIAAEADRCLQDKGFIVIHDFYPPFPFANTYSHAENIFSYKLQYSQMFLWNPEYHTISNTIDGHKTPEGRSESDERIAVTILQKMKEGAYPLDPFKT